MLAKERRTTAIYNIGEERRSKWNRGNLPFSFDLRLFDTPQPTKTLDKNGAHGGSSPLLDWSHGGITARSPQRIFLIGRF